MKIIFSRKGFDSESGGKPSPILDGVTPWSLPIPSRNKIKLQNGLKRPQYGDITIKGINLGDLVENLTNNKIPRTMETHLDPDLDRGSLKRDKNWRPIFGQSGRAESILRKYDVGAGDIFLFFGTFKYVERSFNKYKFKKNCKDMHLIFGWLQIESKRSARKAIEKLSWAKNHPHLIRNHRDPSAAKNDTVYISTEKLKIGDIDTGLPGGGVFKKYNSKLRLSSTDPNHTKSKWELPKWFYPLYDGHECLSSHGDISRWSKKKDHVLLNSVHRGQEFIFNCDPYPESFNWLNQIMEQNKLSKIEIPERNFLDDISFKDKNTVDKEEKLSSSTESLLYLKKKDTISEQTFDKKIKFIDPPKSKNCGPLKNEGYVVFEYNGEKYQLSRHEHANQNNKNAVAVAINLKTGTVVNNLRSFLLRIIDEFNLKVRTHLIITPTKVRSNRELTKEIIRKANNFSEIFKRYT
ncbi:MAG: hypothetical protein K8S18_15255 [Desulfobacula sp.]|nr:hypothetical protein [Desulfobacula sp.]